MQGDEIIFLVQDSIEGGYEAKAMGYSIFTEADTISELREMVRDAVACHFDDENRHLPTEYAILRTSAISTSQAFVVGERRMTSAG